GQVDHGRVREGRRRLGPQREGFGKRPERGLVEAGDRFSPRRRGATRRRIGRDAVDARTTQWQPPRVCDTERSVSGPTEGGAKAEDPPSVPAEADRPKTHGKGFEPEPA